MILRIILCAVVLGTCNLLSAEESALQLLEHPAGINSSSAAPATSKAKSTNPDSDLTQFIDQEEAISTDEWSSHLEKDWDSATHWFQKERHPLFVFMVNSILSIIIGVGIAWGLHYALIQKERSVRRSFRWRLVEELTAPIILLLVLMAVFGFFLPVLQSLPRFYLLDARVFFTLVTLTTAWGGIRLVGVFDERLRQQQNTLDTLMVHITAKLLKLTLVCATLLFIGQRIFDFNITALLAGAGVVGLAIAFASRETLANFFGTMVIIFDRPFRVGDRIQINGIDGLVQCVGMRSTKILTANESLYTIPNSQLETGSIENISHRGVIRYMTTIGIVYESTDAQITQSIQLLHEIADNFKGQDQPAYIPRVFFDTFGDSALNIKLIMWLKTADFKQEEAWRTELNTAIFKRFNDANINMAYNTYTQYLRTDPQHPLAVAMGSTKPNQ